MDELSKRRKWRRWLALIEAEVQRLLDEHRLYTDLRQHLTGKDEWSRLLDTLYLVEVSLAIRRLADANPRHRTVSLVKLLQEMGAHTEYLSRRNALRATDVARRSEVHRLFDSVAGEGSTHIPQAVVQQWIGDFERLAAPFRMWADHRVAHHDLSVDCAPPNRQQIEQVLAFLHAIVQTLNVLLV